MTTCFEIAVSRLCECCSYHRLDLREKVLHRMCRDQTHDRRPIEKSKSMQGLIIKIPHTDNDSHYISVEECV